jgi:ABC-type cobalt transport system substrate-binding protein
MVYISPWLAFFFFFTMVILIIWNSITVWLVNVGEFGGSTSTANTIKGVSVFILIASSLGIVALAVILYRNRKDGKYQAAAAEAASNLGSILGGKPVIVTPGTGPTA